MTNTQEKSKPWWRLRNILLTVGVVFLGLIAFIGYHVHWALTVEPVISVDYAAQLQALCEEGQPEGENGWWYIVEAATMYDEVDAEHRTPELFCRHIEHVDYTAVFDPDAAEQERDIALQALAALESQGVFDEIGKASHCERIVQSINNAGGMLMDADLYGIGVFRDLGKTTTARFHEAILQGDDEEAIEAFDQSMFLADSCCSQAVIIQHMVGWSIASMFGQEVRHLLVEHAIDSEVLRQINDRLQSRPFVPSVTRAYAGERILILDIVQRVYSDDGDGDGVLLCGMPEVQPLIQMGRYASDDTSRLSNLRGYISFESRGDTTQLIERVFADLQSHASMTRPERKAALNGHLPSYDQRFSPRQFVLGVFMPALGKTLRHRDILDCDMAGLRIMVALERSYAANGQYPSALGALVPEYLDALPSDPITGASFAYRLVDEDGSTYLMYSLGDDGVDNGGMVHPENNHTSMTDQGFGYDYVLNLPRPDPESLDYEIIELDP